MAPPLGEVQDDAPLERIRPLALEFLHMTEAAASASKGTKPAKLIQTAGVLVLIVSVIAYVSAEPDYARMSILGFIIGALMYGLGRFLVWWRRD